MKQVFRSKLAWVFGWAWIVFAAWNAWDLISRGSMPSALIAGAVLGVITVFVGLLALRPAIISEEGGVRVRNPFRTAYVPWSSVDQVRVSNAIVIVAGDTTIRCWSPQPSARERAKALRRANKAQASDQRQHDAAAAGRTHADWVAQQLSEMAVLRKRNASGATSMSWSPVAIAGLAVAVALVVVTIALT
ncbi:PH domain-containing protein [Microtetraspora malaysiensis]|uniref:PH domain-containing protein n=1 Tax=Microtetraspora malaysiensis TaxID=161358 RepID=UPI0008346152|nr:PH domain-containing protein [Microtetraspora malaysiensis]